MRRKLKTDAAKKSFRQRQPVLGRAEGRCRSWRGHRAAHLLLRRVHGARRRRRLSHRSRGRARLAAGEPADLFGALLFLPVDRLAAGGEVDRAESQQTSRKVIFVIVLAEKRLPLCCGALQARIPLLRAGKSARPWVRTCAPAPVQSGDEYPAAMEAPPDLR